MKINSTEERKKKIEHQNEMYYAHKFRLNENEKKITPNPNEKMYQFVKNFFLPITRCFLIIFSMQFF